MDTVHVALATHRGRCPSCRLTERPLYWVHGHRRCASCATRTLADERLRPISFGTQTDSRSVQSTPTG